MWECKYGKEPLNTRLFVLRLIRKLPVILLAAVLGAICIGGPYFLTRVTFGPAKEYEAVTDFYIDYAVQEDGTQYMYFNSATWGQLIKDDVITDKILTHMAWPGESADAENAQTMLLSDIEKAAGITKQQLQGYLYATMLSDTRIATTTVTTNDPALTMKIEKALVQAMFDFGEQQKEIAEVRILQEPTEAALVAMDVRTFRACMVGVVLFVFVTVLYLCLYYALDEGIHIPETFEKRFGIPMLGTIRSKELPVLAEKLLTEKPLLLTADKEVDPEQVKKALAERGVEAEEARSPEELSGRKLLLIIKAGAHNGKQIEKTLDFCKKCEYSIAAALLWEADEKLIRAYELPEHVFRAWRRQNREKKI